MHSSPFENSWLDLWEMSLQSATELDVMTLTEKCIEVQTRTTEEKLLYAKGDIGMAMANVLHARNKCNQTVFYLKLEI